MVGQVVTYTDNRGHQLPALVHAVNPTSEKHLTLLLADGSKLVDVTHISIALKDGDTPVKCWDVAPVDISAVKETEQLRVQLAGCLTAAEGTLVDDPAVQGDYGWSPAYQAVVELRTKYDALVEKYDASTEGNDEQLQAIADENAVTGELPTPQPDETRPEQPSDTAENAV